MKKNVIIAVVAGVVLVGGGIGLKVALDHDKAQCEALFGKAALTGGELDRGTMEYHLKLGVVLNLQATIKEWKASYMGKTFSSADPEGAAQLVSQYERDTARVGLLGSDFKRLYGGSYKQFYFNFFVKQIDEGTQPVVIEGIFVDPKKGEVPFKVEANVGA